MYATFPLTCRAASSSFSGHRRRRPLLLLIVPIVVLSMATDFANGMGCASSKDQASSSSSSNRKKNSAGAGTSGARGGSGASNLPDVPYLDQRHWQRCLGHCNQYNSVNRKMCVSSKSILIMEGRQCRCKRSLANNGECVPFAFPDHQQPGATYSGYNL